MAGSARNTNRRSSSSPGYLVGDDGATNPVTTTTAAGAAGRASSVDLVGSNHHQQQHHPQMRQHTPPFPGLCGSVTAPVVRSSSQQHRRKPSSASSEDNGGGGGNEISVSWLQPRIAVVLGVPTFWHPFLFACRLLSIAPALWWGVRPALRFVITDFLRTDGYGYGLGSYDFLGTGGGSGGIYTAGNGGNSNTISGSSTVNWGVKGGAAATGADASGLKCGERRLYLTETALSIIWVCLSAPLSLCTSPPISVPVLRPRKTRSQGRKSAWRCIHFVSIHVTCLLLREYRIRIFSCACCALDSCISLPSSPGPVCAPRI
jgi:hypothetical protein